MGFRLCFCGVNLSGLAETVTAGDLNDRHGKKILVLTDANIPHLGVFLAGFVQKSEKNAKIYVKSFGFSKISINFACGFGDESNGHGRFHDKIRVMAKTVNFINYVEKENGYNRYSISICHTVYSEPHDIIFGKMTEPVMETFQVYYNWRTPRRSMFNLALHPTKTLAESISMMERKIKDLDEKIK